MLNTSINAMPDSTVQISQISRVFSETISLLKNAIFNSIPAKKVKHIKNL
jgi:hypothetical protein